MGAGPVDWDEIFEKFFTVLPNVPSNERHQTVVVIDGQPISWREANNQIKHKTELGLQIGQKLIELEIV